MHFLSQDGKLKAHAISFSEDGAATPVARPSARTRLIHDKRNGIGLSQPYPAFGRPLLGIFENKSLCGPDFAAFAGIRDAVDTEMHDARSPRMDAAVERPAESAADAASKGAQVEPRVGPAGGELKSAAATMVHHPSTGISTIWDL